MDIVSGKKIWLALTAFLLLFIGLSYLAAANQPEEYPAYVSYSPAPSGVQGFYTYLQEEVDNIDRWNASPEKLPASNGSTLLLMIEPSFFPEQPQMDAYLEYIEAGNTILLFQDNPDGMLGMETTVAGEFAEGISSITNEEGFSYQAMVNSFFRLEAEATDEILLQDDKGAVAIKRSIGNGELIAVSASDWLINGQILEEDHLSLILFLLEESNFSRTILIDEYIHGGENAPTLTVLYPHWLIAGAIQLILLTIFWLWYRGKRFGPIIVPREETVRFSDERIQALAAWYQRGRRYQESLAIQADYLKLLFQERFGIAYNREWHQIAERLNQRSRQLPEQDILDFANGITTVLEKEKIDKHEYLVWSKKIDQFRKEVERG